MKVTTYKDFKKELAERGDVFVFRGQANSSYVLIPSGLREQHIKVADKQMFKFVDEMKTSFGFDELTCIEIAQHFLLPTRMLDFSYSYNVALFFACYDPKNKYKEFDGKVFIFNKSKYERVLKEKKKLSSQITRNNKFLYDWLQKYVDKKSPKSSIGEIDMPIFVDATQQFDRLYMQKGLFLLWGRDEIPFEKILENEGIDINELIDTIVIDKDSKEEILEELKVKKNICEDTLYMNISKIKELAKDIKG
ncbi:MAG: FRG domain-containing protein [Gammaproteobacteria bacterium]|nr:FRG domain-containing protein [Gammaproteobacteria bacterium]